MRILALLVPLLTLAAAPPLDERSVMVTGFDRLRVEGPFTVTVVDGSPGAIVRGDSRALDQVAVRVQGTTLVVNTGTLGWEQRAGGRDVAPAITVSATGLRGVQVTGGARVQVAGLQGTRVDVGVNGAGAIDIARLSADDLAVTLTGTGRIAIGGGTAGRARMLSYGAGTIDADGLTVGEANVRAESTGALALGVRYTATIAALGAGPVRIVGAPECTVSGPGPVDCANIKRR
ncbi:GIN domain-containing protein [Sphingomonas sp. CJ20]